MASIVTNYYIFEIKHYKTNCFRRCAIFTVQAEHMGLWKLMYQSEEIIYVSAQIIYIVQSYLIIT